MMREFDVVVYGSYGYTGNLIVEKFKGSKERVLLSGRDKAKLEEQSRRTGFPFQSVDIVDDKGLTDLLSRANIVLHCAGPFHKTATQMVNACLKTATHYMDITGEYAVFEMLAARGRDAENAGIIVMPGAGFDVVPSDCLALHLKNRLPDATHLTLAFAMSGGGLSRGTSRTMIDGLGTGSMIRKDGRLTPIPLGSKTMKVRFCNNTKTTMCIPWGDISTAWRSTGIPNIEVYTGVPASTIMGAKLIRPLEWLLRNASVKNFLRKKIDAKPSGPSEEKRSSGKSYLWGCVKNKAGVSVEARLQTLSGYSLTAETSLLIVQKMLRENPRPGYFTPAQYFGEGLIFEIEGTTWC
jgi:short subunit dehydrogenase-like uncharacterized protein